jgi:hypothetical protein
MEIPILVAIISVAGSLLGTVVGGSIVVLGNYFLVWRRERSEFRTACRLVEAELQEASVTVKYAIDKKTLWRPDEEPSTDAWKQHKHVLAQHLSLDDWDDVREAVYGVTGVNVIAVAYRSDDKTEVLDEAAAAFALMLKQIQKGRFRLFTHHH